MSLAFRMVFDSVYRRQFYRDLAEMRSLDREAMAEALHKTRDVDFEQHPEPKGEQILVPVEAALLSVQEKIADLGPDARLTEAVVLIGAAYALVQSFIDSSRRSAK